MLVAGPAITEQKPLGTRTTFADLGATICEYLGLRHDDLPGTSALGQLGVKK
jgi:phosphopentomutase